MRLHQYDFAFTMKNEHTYDCFGYGFGNGVLRLGQEGEVVVSVMDEDETRRNIGLLKDPKLSDEVRSEVVERLYWGHTRLVASVFQHVFGSHWKDYELDLLQAGNMALLRTFDGFDLRETNTFSSYAYPSIQRAMQLQLSSLRGVVIRSQDVKSWKKIQVFAQQFWVQHQHEPSDADLIEFLNLSGSELITLRSLFLEPYSLDGSDTEDNQSEFYRRPIIDECPVSWQVEQLVLRQIILKAMEAEDINMIAHQVVRLRLGSDGTIMMPFREIGEQLAISEDLARYYYLLAIKQLQKHLKKSAGDWL